MTTFPQSDIPTKYSSKKAYFAARDSLIADEHSLSFTASAESSPLEIAASKIVDTLKHHERTTLYGQRDDAGSYLEHAHQYLHAKDVIDSARLFEIAKRAPKGALLHAHFDAMLPPSSLLELARDRENMCISTTLSASDPAFMADAEATFQVQRVRDLPQAQAVSCFDPTYIPGTFTTYARFCTEFPGGRNAVEGWIAKRIILSEEDVYHPRQTVDGMWTRFNRVFRHLRGLLCYETAYIEHFRRVLRDLVAENISYAEIRVFLGQSLKVVTDDGEEILAREELLQRLVAAMADEVAASQHAGKTFHGVKIIYTVRRDIEEPELRRSTADCISMKQQFPDLICGFDLAGQEDAGHPLIHHVPALLAMHKECNRLKLDLPFILHAGETLSDGTETDSNLYDALLLGSKRIGHGYSITKHPHLMELCKVRKVALEVCPISNEILGLCGGIRSHPLMALLARNVPCTINSDDPGCFQSTLSHDFYQVLTGSDNMTLVGWRILIQWSFDYACWTGLEKQERLNAFRAEWEEFCQHIIDNYGSRRTVRINRLKK